MDRATRREFASRLQAMRAYAGVEWREVASQFPSEGQSIEERLDVIRKWGSRADNAKDEPSEIEARALADWLSEKSLADDRLGLPATFLWPVPTARLATGDDAAEARQITDAMRVLLDRLQGPLRPGGLGEQSQ